MEQKSERINDRKVKSMDKWDKCISSVEKCRRCIRELPRKKKE